MERYKRSYSFYKRLNSNSTGKFFKLFFDNLHVR